MSFKLKKLSGMDAVIQASRVKRHNDEVREAHIKALSMLPQDWGHVELPGRQVPVPLVPSPKQVQPPPTSWDRDQSSGSSRADRRRQAREAAKQFETKQRYDKRRDEAEQRVDELRARLGISMSKTT